MAISSFQGLMFGGCYGLVFGSFYEYKSDYSVLKYLKQIGKYQIGSCLRIVPILMVYRVTNLYLAKNGYNENLSYVGIIGTYVLGEMINSKIKNRKL